MIKKLYLFLTLLTAFLWLGTGTMRGDELTVYAGSNTKSDVPVKGSHMDTQGTHIQVIYPASSIESMVGQSITAIKFYSTSTSNVAWTGNVVEVKLKEVASDEFVFDYETYKRAFIETASTDLVFTGHIEIKDQVTIIEFDDPFTYTGTGNLLYDLLVTTAGSWTTTSYYGLNQSNYPALFSTTKDATTGNGSQFLPKTTFTYESLSSCTKPTSIDIPSEFITQTSAKITWEGENNTILEYKLHSDENWTVVSTLDATTYHVLTDLEANKTKYDVRVKNDCGSEQSSYTASSFQTECGVISSLPWEYGFEDKTETGSGNIPYCWNSVTYTNGTTVYPFVKAENPRSGNNSLTFYGGKVGYSYIILPDFEADIKDLILSFYYRNYNSSYLTDTDPQFSVGYFSTPGDASTFVELVDDNNPLTRVASYTQVEFDLSSLKDVTPSVKNIVIRYGGFNYNAQAWIDDIRVERKSSCTKPTALSYTNLTASSVDLSWTAGGSETAWKVQYSEDNSSWSEAVAATSNPFVLTGLNDNTLYYVRVAADCGESISDYTSATVSFTTKCAAITSFPWSEDFQGETNETNIVCWDNSASTCFSNPAGMTPSKYVWGVIRTGSYGDYNYQLYMRNFNVRAGTALINTPSFTLPSDKDMQLVFNYSHLSNCDPLVVKISQNGGAFAAIDGASYSNDPAGSYNYSSPGTYKEATIDLSAYRGKTITLQFFTTANYGEGAIWLDNVRIEAAPTCFKPQNLSAASSITPDGATFTWAASGHGETTYQWVVAAGSDAPVWEDNAAHKTSELTKTVTGLAAGTYKFYVRSYCDSEDQSDAAVSASFTTATVAAPTIGTITTTNTTAHATWTAPSVSFPVQYQWSTNGSVWSDATSNLYADLTSLSASTSYTFYVRSYYDASHIGSAATKTFTTECDPITVAVGTPFEQNFNDVTTNAIPDCWKNNEGTTTTASYKWKVVTGGQSGKCAMFNGTDNGSGKTNVFATPLLTINSDADLSFYWKNKKTGAYIVEISVDGASRTTLVGELTGKDAWTLVDMPLTSYNGHTIQLFFCGTSISDGNANLYLDEFKITPVSCRKPASDPVVSSKDDTHATLTWTAGGTNTDYQFALALKDEAPVWEDANVVTALTKSFDDLTPLTWYDFYVRTYCDESNQSDARKVTFRTDCAGFVTLPFEEDFESVAINTIPDCWSSVGTLESASYEWKVANYSGRNNSKGIQCGLSVEDVDKTNILATPTIRLTNENILLTFWCKKTAGDNFVVEISTNGGSTTTQIKDLTSLGATAWSLQYVDLSAYKNNDVIIYFKGTSAGDYEGNMFYLDDVRVARGEFFDDAANSGVETRINALDGQTIDFVMNRPMQFNGAYNTLCLPFDINAEDMADSDHPLYNNTVKVFDYATIGENELLLAIRSASSIEAGVPCFVKYDGLAGDARNAFLFKEVTIKAGLTPTVDGDASYEGIYEPIAVTAETNNGPHHIIFVGADNQLYWPGANRTMRGFRAYFHIDANSLNGNPIKPGMPARMVEHHNTPTDIKNINAENGAVIKRLENNQVVIIRNGVKYNIQGQVISK